MRVPVLGKEVNASHAAHAATGGVGLAGIGLAIEAYRMYLAASDKAGVTLGVAMDKASCK